jgi:hypothetical protein
VTALILLLISHGAVAAFAYWVGWDNRGDVEWNRQHGIDTTNDLVSPPTTGDDQP